MRQWRAEIYVGLRPSVNDPEGLSIGRALRTLGFTVEAVRAGKSFDIRFTADDRARAEADAERMCSELLANPVIETYRFTLVEEPPPAP